MAPILAGVGALGVESLTVAFVQTAQSAWLYATGTFFLRNAEPQIALAYAFAIVFAFGSARRRGVVAAIALLGLVYIEQAVLNVPGRQTFCERSGSPCDWVAVYWPQVRPQLAGIALGLLAVRSVRRGARGSAALAIGIAAFGLSFSVGRLAFVPFLGAAPVGDAARDAANIVIGTQILGALAAGLVCGAFGKRHIIDAAILVGYFVGPWSPQLRVPDLFYTGFHIEQDWRLVVPVGDALVALLGLAIGSIGSRYRTTSIPTIP